MKPGMLGIVLDVGISGQLFEVAREQDSLLEHLFDDWLDGGRKGADDFVCGCRGGRFDGKVHWNLLWVTCPAPLSGNTPLRRISMTSVKKRQKELQSTHSQSNKKTLSRPLKFQKPRRVKFKDKNPASVEGNLMGTSP